MYESDAKIWTKLIDPPMESLIVMYLSFLLDASDFHRNKYCMCMD